MNVSDPGTSETTESFDNSSSISESMKYKPRRSRCKSRSKRRVRDRGLYIRPRMNAPANTTSFLIQDAMKAKLDMVMSSDSKQDFSYVNTQGVEFKGVLFENYLEESEHCIHEKSQMNGSLELKDPSDVSESLEVEDCPEVSPSLELENYPEVSKSLELEDYPDDSESLDVEDHPDESDYESDDSFVREEAFKHQERISGLPTDKIREDCCNLEVECIELQSHIELEEKVKNILLKIRNSVNNGVDLVQLDTDDESHSNMI